MPTASKAESVNILLVDDQPANLEALEAILEGPEYRLIKATSGREALMWVLKEEFALILLDVMMPEMDGFEVAAMVKQRQASNEIPIIFLSAADPDRMRSTQGYKAGAVDFLAKPLDPNVVRAKVAVFVNLYRQKRQIEAQSVMLQESTRLEALKALADLRKTVQQRYQNLADAIPQLLWTTRADRQVEFVNRRFVEFTGRPLDDAIGEGWRASIHGEDILAFDATWKRAEETQQPFEAECRIKNLHGIALWHLCQGLLEKDDAGNVVGWLLTFTNVEPHKEMERALKTSLKDKDALIKEVHHRVKNNMQIISSLLNLQAGYMADETVQHAFRQSQDRIKSMALVHEQLYQRKNFSSIEMDDYLRSLLDAAAASHARTASRLYIELKAEKLTVDPDKALTCGLITNELLSNCLTHAFTDGRKGQVTVELTGLADGKAQLIVRDDGMGLPKGFDWKLADSLGFGLVSTLTDQLQGTAQVKSAPEQGTEFTLQFKRMDQRKGARA